MVAAALVSGVVPLSRNQDSAHPPCERLPPRAAVTDAVASHQDLVARLQAVGSGVRVEVATVCGSGSDAALVSITYATESERSGVDALLLREGFGVPVQLVSG